MKRIQQSENTEAGSSFRRLHERTYRIFLAYFFLSWSSSTMSSIIITLFLNFKFLKNSTFEYQIVDLTMTPTVVTQWERHFRLWILYYKASWVLFNILRSPTYGPLICCANKGTVKQIITLTQTIEPYRIALEFKVHYMVYCILSIFHFRYCDDT